MAYIKDVVPSSSALSSAASNIANAAKGVGYSVAPAAGAAAIAAGVANMPNVSNINTGGSGGGKGGTGGSGGGNTAGPTVAAESGFDYASYYAELAAQARARAQAAYERNMARIADAYGSASGSLKSNYDSTVDRLNAARDKSMGDVRNDAEDSLRQAYINNMMTRRNLNQRLSAMGYNGGATESTMSSLENQYGKSRTGINETLNKNISNLDMTYGDNLASALQSYNSAMANLNLQRMQMEMQAENALQNAEASSMNSAFNIDGSYMSALQAALANQNNYQYDASKATNDYVAGQAQQAQSAAEGTNYSKALQQAMLEATDGKVNGATLAQLSGYNANTLANLIAQLRRNGYSIG